MSKLTLGHNLSDPTMKHILGKLVVTKVIILLRSFLVIYPFSRKSGNDEVLETKFVPFLCLLCATFCGTTLL